MKKIQYTEKPKPLRGSNFPHHNMAKIKPPSTNGYGIRHSSSGTGYNMPAQHRQVAHDSSPSTYMVVNFAKDFEVSENSEGPPPLKLDSKQMKSTVEKFNGSSPSRAARLPSLQATFRLPKKIDESTIATRNMFRREDTAVQTDMYVEKEIFPGLPEYQEWSSKIVEPFFKVSNYLYCILRSTS